MNALPVILCESCGYDITPLAQSARTTPALLCPECGVAVCDSFPSRRSGTPWQQRHTFMNALRTIFDAHFHPCSMWRRVRPESTDFPLWTNVALFVPIPLALLCAPFIHIYALVLWAASVVILLLTMLAIVAVAHCVAYVLRWRSPPDMRYAALDHASCYWPSTIALSVILFVSLTYLSFATTLVNDLVVLVLFMLMLLAPPLVVLASTLYGLRALRYANPVTPTPTNADAAPPALDREPART